MIRLLCFGDSHTFGDELWEEFNVPGYTSMSHEDSIKHLTFNEHIKYARQNLTYVGFIRSKKPNWQVHNFGRGGFSQSAITMEVVKRVSAIKKMYPEDQLICSIQDTYRTRYTYHNPKNRLYEGLNTDQPEKNVQHHPEVKDLVIYAERFLNEELLATQFYCSSLGIKEWLKQQCIPNFNFSFYEHSHHYNNDEGALDILKQEYLKGVSIFPRGAAIRAMKYYGITNDELKLPGYHIKHRYHEIIADDIINYIETSILG